MSILCTVKNARMSLSDARETLKDNTAFAVAVSISVHVSVLLTEALLTAESEEAEVFALLSDSEEAQALDKACASVDDLISSHPPTISHARPVESSNGKLNSLRFMFNNRTTS